jgi:hypothetical protein
MEFGNISREEIISKTNVLLETSQGGKHFAIGIIDWILYEPTRLSRFSRRTKKMSKNVYVIFWGNTNDKDKMGITPVLTPKSYVASKNVAFKTYFEMVNAADEMTFKN